MVTRFNLVYSVSAVKRILSLPAQAQVVIREFFRVVWVWVVGKRPTFISKQAFKQHFVDRRKAAARALTTTQHVGNPAMFTVRNKQSTYLVECRASGLFCSCEDFNNQLEYIGRGCCKHGYAVLSRLGLGDLSAYLSAIKNDITRPILLSQPY